MCFFLLFFLFLGAFAVYLFFVSQEPEPEYPYDPPDPSSAEDPVIGPVAQQLIYDFDSLLAQNEDFIAWLHIPGTVISFPVVQGADNDYYLTHDFSGAYSVFGCPFLDTRTPSDGENLVIHGHNMGNNRTELFSTLLYFQDPEYAKEHTTIQLARPGREEDTYTLFAVANVNVYDPSAQYIRSVFSHPSDRSAFLTSLQSHSLYPSGEIPEGQILILSTCNRTYGADNRLILVAIQTELVEEH